MSADTENQVPSLISVSHGIAAGVSNDQFLTVREIATRWKLSPDKVRRVFAREPGVLIFSNETVRGHKRNYSTLRIPRAVLLRVERKLSLGAYQNSEQLRRKDYEHE